MNLFNKEHDLDWENRRKEHDALLRIWKSQYESLENDNCEFTWDGPSDWQRYSQQSPRILFLLKEAQGDWWQPCLGLSTTDRRRFSTNIALWKHVLKTLYQNPNEKMDFPDIEMICRDHSDVAFVEVKKLNQGKSKSDNSEINAYARKDKKFLKEQIDLLEPHIVLCAYTVDSYDLVHDELYQPYTELSSRDKCKCWQLGDRLVIDFLHPSNRKNGPEELYSLLCSLITEGCVFDKFSWSKWYVQK